MTFSSLALVLSLGFSAPAQAAEPVVIKFATLAPEGSTWMKVMNDLNAELQAKTPEFRKRLESGETVDDLLPEAFAVVKDTCRRLVGKKWPVVGIETPWDMVPFDVQGTRKAAPARW